MTTEDVIGLTVVAIVVLVPILAVSARLALRPIVDSLVRLQQAFGSSNAPESTKRIAELEGQVSQLAAQVRRLEEAEAFQRELKAGTPAARSLPGPKAGTGAP